MEGGVIGFMTGFGKGLFGAPVKALAAASGFVAYPLLGIDMNIQEAYRKLGNPVREGKIKMGDVENFDLKDVEKSRIRQRWVELTYKKHFWSRSNVQKFEIETEVFRS